MVIEQFLYFARMTHKRLLSFGDGKLTLLYLYLNDYLFVYFLYLFLLSLFILLHVWPGVAYTVGYIKPQYIVFIRRMFVLLRM